MTRDEKLAILNKKKADKVADKSVMSTPAGPLLNVFSSKVKEFTDALGGGVEVDAYELIEALKDIKTLAPLIKDFTDAFNDLPSFPEVPKSIEVTGLNLVSSNLKDISTDTIKALELLEKIRHIELPNISVQVDGINKDNTEKITNKVDELIKGNTSVASLNDVAFQRVIDKLTILTKAVIDSSVKSQQSQGTEDFIPVRRVRQVGNKFIYDDDAWSSSTGGAGMVSSSYRPTDKYKYHAEANDGTYEYLFYEAVDGDWYVAREVITTGYLDFAKGTGGIDTAYVDNVSPPNSTPVWSTYAGTF